MKPVFIGDSPLVQLVGIIQKRKGDLATSLYTSPNPDPFQYGMRVGRINELDEILSEVNRLLRGLE